MSRHSCRGTGRHAFIAISDPRRLRATTQIAVVDIAGKRGMRVLTGGPGEKWSPHGLGTDRIAYASGGPDRGLESTSGGSGPRGEFNNPDWSPDGRRMVFDRDIGQNWPPVVQLPAPRRDPAYPHRHLSHGKTPRHGGTWCDVRTFLLLALVRPC
jgi:Tol biopolymer transport system component